VACDFEPAAHSNFSAAVDGSWLLALGYPGPPSLARLALARDLRDRFAADGAFVAKVVNDRGFATGRGSALLFGPQVTWFRSSTPFIVAHETAHAFGALDEYCPDACPLAEPARRHRRRPPTQRPDNDGTGWLGGAARTAPA